MAKVLPVRLAAVVVGLGLLAGPVHADGLSQFEKIIKPQIPPGTLTYKSSKALGDEGFQLDDVVITPPPSEKDKKPEPIKVKTLTVERVDFEALEKQQPPLYAKIKFDGLTSGSNAGGMDLKQMAGIDNLAADFGINYELDPDDKTFTLKRLELNLNGLGKIQTSFEIDNVGPEAATKPSEALNDASLKTANLIYDDHSLLAKALPVVAAMQGTDPKALIEMAINVLDSARAGQGAEAQQAIDSLVAYVEDYKNPKGPLKIDLAPPDKVTNEQLSNAKSADEMIKLLGVKVSYAGKRSSTPQTPPKESK